VKAGGTVTSHDWVYKDSFESRRCRRCGTMVVFRKDGGPRGGASSLWTKGAKQMVWKNEPYMVPPGWRCIPRPAADGRAREEVRRLRQVARAYVYREIRRLASAEYEPAAMAWTESDHAAVMQEVVRICGWKQWRDCEDGTATGPSQPTNGNTARRKPGRREFHRELRRRKARVDS
jgi:hypothetical protein